MNTRTIPAIVLAAAFAAAIHSADAQLITNGGFETPDVPIFVTINAGQTTIAPWVVGLTSVDVVDDNTIAITGTAFQGGQFLDLDGTPGPGKLTQAFPTTPGLLYAVTFAYANNYTGQPSASATVRLFDGLGERLNQTITHGTSQSGSLNWTLFNDQFIAAQNTTSLEFTSLSIANASGGILIDAVAVQVVPEPASTALLLFGAALCFRRRRTFTP